MTFTKETFENLKNKTFNINFGDNHMVQSELIEINVNNNIPVQEGQKTPFSLVFESESKNIYDQNTYMIKNDELQETAIFLVPIGEGNKGVRYEAVFS